MSVAFLSACVILNVKCKLNDDHVENRRCEENKRPSFGDHTKGFSRNHKSTKNYIISR